MNITSGYWSLFQKPSSFRKGMFLSAPQPPLQNLYYWQGKINGNIPVFLYLNIKDSLIKGSLVYTKTKFKTPIQLVGRIDGDGDIRVFEFEKDGNITGVFVFDSLGNNARGTWASSKTGKEYSFSLSKKDTLLINPDTSFTPRKIAGEYSYAFGEKGSQGGISIMPVGKGKIAFEVSAVTREPARNIAQVEKDTVSLAGNQFYYKVPGSDSCIFRVKLCNNFLYISYANGYAGCIGMFGHNATVEGVFIKITK